MSCMTLLPFHIGLVEAANVIPLTFLIPESLVQSDFPEGNPNSIDLYNKYASENSRRGTWV